MQLTIVTHFCTDDTECSGDYAFIEVLNDEGEQIAEYGDDYHDKGTAKVEGLIYGARLFTEEHIDLEYKDVADFEDY